MDKAPKKRKNTRRRNGEGSTYRYKNGWRTKLTRGTQTVTAMGRSEQESRRLAKEKLAKLPLPDESLVTESTNLLFGDYMINWLTKKHVKNITHTTYRRYESLTMRHILPALGHIKIREVTKNHINAFIENMDEQGQSPRSCQQARALLSAAFKRALQDDLVSANPVARSRGVKVDSPQIHPLSREEVMQLLRLTVDVYLQARVRIAVLFGLRQGEALGLQWKDVDLERGQLFIWQQLQKVNGEYVWVKLKSKFSVRTLDLDPMTINSLRAHKSAQNAQRLALGELWQDNDLVFPGSKGRPMNSHTDFTHWQKALAAAGLPIKRLHDARHTAATLLYDAGMDIETIRRFMGHASVLLTSRTYVHHSSRQMKGIAEAIEAIGI
ncbi:site-specific integrase [Actinobacteria bacterium IMCC26103]|nr:site-specific integrase [Actinobacteria bacterium IMCC26103]